MGIIEVAGGRNVERSRRKGSFILNDTYLHMDATGWVALLTFDVFSSDTGLVVVISLVTRGHIRIILDLVEFYLAVVSCLDGSFLLLRWHCLMQLVVPLRP